MNLLKKGILFTLGGGGYYGLELLWRGRSHSTMFLLGGACFLLMGRVDEDGSRLPLGVRMGLGALICTAGELLFGLLFNRNYSIWDYRELPLNLGGQICLWYSGLWLMLSAGAMWLYRRCDRALSAMIRAA